MAQNNAKEQKPPPFVLSHERCKHVRDNLILLAQQSPLLSILTVSGSISCPVNISEVTEDNDAPSPCFFFYTRLLQQLWRPIRLAKRNPHPSIMNPLAQS